MPVLPASGYSTPTAPTVEPSPTALSPYQEIRAPVEAFGGATAEAFTRFGTQAEKAATNLENIQTFYDQVVVDEQKNSYDDFLNKKLYGDPNVPGDVGYMGLQGKNALEQRESVRREIDARLIEQRSTLKNARQLHLFNNETSRYRNYALSQIGRHYDDQYNRHTAQVAESRMKLDAHKGAVAANNNDFGMFKTSLESALTANEQALRARGADDATIAAQRTAVVQAFTATWASNAIERNAPEGRQFVLDHKEELGDKYDEFLHKAEKAALQYDVEKLKRGEAPTGSQPNLVRGGATQAAISNTGKEHYSTARRLGASHNEAVLLTAAAEVESNFNPDATHDAEYLAARGRPPGRGMYGHNAERLEAMQRRYGPRPNFEQQIEFALEELRSRPEGARVNAAKTAEELRDLQNEFERPKRTPEGDAKRLKATQKYLALSGSSTEPVQSPASAGGDTPSITYAGDSLAGHQIRPKLGVGGGGQESGQVDVYNKGDTAVAGWNSKRILEEVLPNIPEAQIKGKAVALSTGVSNAKNAAEAKQFLEETIPAQIALLRERGAKNIVLMGVGTHPKLAGVNERLSQIAEQNKDVGVVFAGPQRKTQKDQIHSSDQKAEAQAVQEALSKTTALPTPEAGIQAVARDLREEAVKSGTSPTIRTLMPAEVDTAVAHTGFGPDQPLDLSKPEVMAKTLEALTLARTGKITSEDKQLITRALSLTPADTVAPTVAQITPPGSNMPMLPPNEPGELPDGEVPGLLEKLKQGAKLLPPNSKPELWNTYVRQVRQEHNMAYQAEMQRERQRAVAQQRADREIGDQYYERIVPGSTNMPSEAEILKDTRISQEKRKDIIGVMHGLNKKDPDPAVTNNNMVEAYKGIGLPEGDPDRIYRKDQIDKLYGDKKITWDMRKELQNVLDNKNHAKRQWTQPHITQLLKDAERVLFPLKHLQGGMGLQMDPGGSTRERAYQMFVERTVEEYIAEGKDVRRLIDPGSPDKPNPEYLGSQSILDKFAVGARTYGPGQANAKVPVPGELKDNASIMQAYREGRFGVPGSPEALELAKQYSISAGLSQRRSAAPNTGAPMR